MIALVGRWIGLLVALVGALFVGRALWREWDQVGPALQDARLEWLLAGLVFAAVGMVGIAMAWRLALGVTGPTPRLLSTLRWYFVGELGKYIPGGIWAVVGRAEIPAREGWGRSHTYPSVLLSLAATYLCGIAFALVLLVGRTPEALGGLELAGLVALLICGALALHPSVVGRAFAMLSVRHGRFLETKVPSWAGSLGLIAANLPSWIAMGLATWCVAMGLGLNPPVLEIMMATALSWVVGFLVLPAPGGLGVREAAFTLMATSLPGGGAAAVAVVARLLFMAVDALGAAAFSLATTLERRR